MSRFSIDDFTRVRPGILYYEGMRVKSPDERYWVVADVVSNLFTNEPGRYFLERFFYPELRQNKIWPEPQVDDALSTHFQRGMIGRLGIIINEQGNPDYFDAIPDMRRRKVPIVGISSSSDAGIRKVMETQNLLDYCFTGKDAYSNALETLACIVSDIKAPYTHRA